MKKQFLFATLALATMFTACSKEEELSKNEGGTPVNFVIGGIGARTATDASYVTTFEENDEVGLFSTGLVSDMANVKYTVNSAKTGLETDNATEYVFGEGNATFYAYYPWATSLTSSTVGLTIKTDQNITNDADNFNCNDLLVATASGSSASTDGVTLSFDHVMSFVEVSFGANLTSIGVSSVTMNVKPTIAYDFTSSENTKYSVTGDAIDVTMYNNNGKFWAIVPPQTIAAGTALFTITANNSRTYTYTVAADQTEEFNSNNIRKIKLEVASEEEPSTATVFKIASIVINGWGNVNNVTEEEIEVVEDRLVAELSIPNTITTVNYAELSDTSPFSVSGVTVESVEEDNENIIKLTSGTGTNWYGNTLFFYAGSANQIIVGQKYKISFDAKAETNSVALHAFAHKKTKDVNQTIIYALDSDTSTQNSLFSNNVTTEQYTTYSFTINTSKDFLVTSVTNNNASKYTGTVEDSNLVISFRPAYSNTGDTGTYYIKNIKIEQQ